MEKLIVRNSFYDNAKFVLIFFVVIGHFIEPFCSSNITLDSIFRFIYLFHMPAFIFISGYFSKKDINLEVITRLFLDYIILFLFVQILFVLFTRLLGSQEYHYFTLVPVYIYWYLPAAFAWNIILKILIYIFERLKIRLEFLIGLSIIIGLVAGYCNFISWTLSLSRIVVFFPFFITGYYFKIKKLNIYNVISHKNIASCIILTGFAATIIFHNIFLKNLLLCSESYAKIGIGKFGIFYRLLLYIIQTLLTISFFSLIPRHKTLFTSFGSRTLNIYILHGFVVYSFILLSYFESISLVKILLLPVIAMLVVIYTGRIPVTFFPSKWINLFSHD